MSAGRFFTAGRFFLFLHPKGPFVSIEILECEDGKAPNRPRWPLRALIKTQNNRSPCTKTPWKYTMSPFGKGKTCIQTTIFWGFILIFGGLPCFQFENSRKPFRNSMRSPHPVQCSWQTDGYCNWLEVELIQVEKYSLEHLAISQGENQQFKYI